MRINKFVALATGMSRRAADESIGQGRVLLNTRPARPGQDVHASDSVTLDGQTLHAQSQTTTIMLNKPPGYVVSRSGQGSKTIYDLLPPELHHLKPVGRLDKDSSGLLLLTNDGALAQELTHPRYQKTKIYEVELDKPLDPSDKDRIEQGIKVDDYTSRLQLSKIKNGGQQAESRSWRVSMNTGRNRQIRRTFAALGYKVTRLHRTQFGPYTLATLQPGQLSHCR